MNTNKMRDEIGKVEGAWESLWKAFSNIGSMKGASGQISAKDRIVDLFYIKKELEETQVKWNKLREKIRPEG